MNSKGQMQMKIKWNEFESRKVKCEMKIKWNEFEGQNSKIKTND